ncbi:hypothetical protein A2291_06160 [candidate division WOR-1 bacterium RIFOXYB2_FULL_42_35]|uniref:Uncharacterized protein n=1 Tax=candidate division WOR-1 bacterium RIFOXYC2_FULL_41_25 TaxID=1802586 RepID=A0A1F4TRK7_UNCSA|nr:MAG: hypothetical protein A2247_04040 [candidate division WOR-1 bacterium RIFOXYA2_FULL_41_14]OGC24971.1 MAG: hypothetical protein A2291_06160 [candidate division WOR-1 bacterium RIFOXYB2_FULL_42_35]OGC35170.1 MAG: hypothetical protein A2462_02115 [candidate division WOR-1 bacterium RIFOXYC2_FULL_41_25]
MSPLSPAEALNRFSDPAQVQLQAILQKRSAQAQAVRRTLRLTGHLMSEIYSYPKDTDPAKLIGTQNARCRDLLSYLSVALGLTIVSPKGKAVNETDGSVSVEVKGELPVIEGLADFLRKQGTFWLYSLGSPEGEKKIASGFDPGEETFKALVKDFITSWKATALWVYNNSWQLKIGLQATLGVLQQTKPGKAAAIVSRDQSHRLVFSNPGNGGLLDYLFRQAEIVVLGGPAIDVAQLAPDSLINLEVTPFDKFVWIKSVKVLVPEA